VDPKFLLCDGLGESFVGLGWVEEIGPTYNSRLDPHTERRFPEALYNKGIAGSKELLTKTASRSCVILRAVLLVLRIRRRRCRRERTLKPAHNVIQHYRHLWLTRTHTSRHFL